MKLKTNVLDQPVAHQTGELYHRSVQYHPRHLSAHAYWTLVRLIFDGNRQAITKFDYHEQFV